MRIYEYAKKNKFSSKELLAVLKDGGFEFASHMSLLTPEALEFLNKKLLKKTATKKPVLRQAPVSAKALTRRQALRQAQDDRGREQKTTEKPEAKPIEKPVVKKVIEKEKKIEKPKKVIIRPMLLGNAADEMGKPATDLILLLLKWGVVCAKNQMLPADLVERLAKHFELEFEHLPSKKQVEKFEKSKELVGGEQQERSPVVVVMGHVDHGKTTLLDFIRKARVASREKGGITQHLGAYEVETPQGNIVFLDTPGHEAFSRIRMRGSRVADIAVLVIAADDGVMPQTVEAIKHAKSVDLPIIVAINKIDRVKSDMIEKTKQDLTKYDLLPEDWGGNIICVPISAKLGQGVDSLLDMIILQSQMMELKADRKVSARGYVLESKIEKGRGPVATLILQHGVVNIGDFFVCGKTYGKINSMIDSYGKRVKSVGPSAPVLVAGFQELPEAGDFFEAVSLQEYKKAKQGKREIKPTATKFAALVKEDSLNLIIKTDSDSSKDALLWAIDKISKDLEKGFNLVQVSVGDISEGDIDLAAATNSFIVGLHVKAEAKASSMAQRVGVSVKLYDIIYKLVEFLQEYAESKKEIKKELKKVGEAVVLRVFDIKNVGVIAGCAVKDGRFSRDGSVVIFRGGRKVGEGKIKSLQRENKMVKEVHAGFECAFLVDGFSEWEVDDKVECYLVLPQ
ncbi:translation initiation factor IF-2 [Candidatus Dependentiae bacterium]